MIINGEQVEIFKNADGACLIEVLPRRSPRGVENESPIHLASHSLQLITFWSFGDRVKPGYKYKSTYFKIKFHGQP